MFADYPSRVSFMNDGLSFGQIAMLSAYAGGMAVGQILFKMAALRAPAGGALGERLLGMVGNGYFVAAIGLYAALALFWVWILSFTPLSRGYAFVALAFALTPFLAALIFSEPITARLVIGVGLIAFGLVLVAG
jgi:drug/metabolite transporter (DMT)-like permease